MAFVHPYVFIVPDDEEPWEVKLEEINSVNYNHGKLIRLVAGFDVANVELQGLICYDGTFVLPRTGIYKDKNKAIDFFNQIFLHLNLCGFLTEYVDHRDVLYGQLYENWGARNLEFGNSAAAQLHSKNRTRVSSNFDTIMLSNPRTIKVSELHEMLKKGDEILKTIPNLSPKFLNIGLTEIRYENWDLVLSNLWISAEQLIAHLWHQVFLKNKQQHPAINIAGRKASLQDDNRTWSAVVKQELLYQTGIISESILASLFEARKARNKLVHEGMSVDKKIAIRLFSAVTQLLATASGKEIEFAPIQDDEVPRATFAPEIDFDIFEEWRLLRFC